MSDEYGIQPTGYIRKPLAVILAELEAAMITEFGPGVIQTPQSPFGQLNGLMADLIAEIDERNLELYQSYDPDQAEGVRLDILGRLRLIQRTGQNDSELRGFITNENRARIDTQDLTRAIKNIENVSFVKVFVNDTGEITNSDLENSTISICVIGGEDSEISKVIRKYIVPGINTYGNHRVNSEIDGFCRSFSIIRPSEVNVSLVININSSSDRNDCPPPSPTAIKNLVVEQWLINRINGYDPNFYTIRTIIESNFSNLEVLNVIATRDQSDEAAISFIEIASITSDNITVNMS